MSHSQRLLENKELRMSFKHSLTSTTGSAVTYLGKKYLAFVVDFCTHNCTVFKINLWKKFFELSFTCHPVLCCVGLRVHSRPVSFQIFALSFALGYTGYNNKIRFQDFCSFNSDILGRTTIFIASGSCRSHKNKIYICLRWLTVFEDIQRWLLIFYYN